MSIRVGIVGISGYGGGEALRLCAAHPEFRVVYAAGESSAGQALSQRYPGLPTALGNLANDDSDVVSVDVSGSFSDPDVSDALTFTATGLPAGVLLNKTTGLLTGRPTKPGNYLLTITASNSAGVCANQRKKPKTSCS